MRNSIGNIMSILKVQGHPNLVRDLKTQAIVNVDSDAYARYMARKKKQQAKDDELKDVVREINTIKAEMIEIKNLIKESLNGN